MASSRRKILWALETAPTLIITGETGCGKSTQVPKYLAEGGYRCVAVAEPRALAATSLAAKVQEDLHGTSYAVPLDDDWEKSTRVLFTTAGWLLKSALFDPKFEQFSCIVVDEVHERTIAVDVLLGLLKKVQRKRSLKVVCMSATADVETLLKFFGENAKALTIQGPRGYPVDTFFSQKHELGADYVAKAITVALDIHRREADGDVLIFLPSARDVDECVGRLKKDVDAMPLYAAIDGDAKRRIFSYQGKRHQRRIIVATSIAETALTVPNIKFVIDSGVSKMSIFDARAGCRLAVSTVSSKSTAKQRAGRAGRIAHGKCYRLYTEESYQNFFPLRDPPEIAREDLSWTLLQFKALGVDNIVAFDLPTAPPAVLLVAALDELRALGALDDDAKLTETGDRLATAPCEPRAAKFLLSATNDKVRAVLVVAFLQSGRPLRYVPRYWSPAKKQQADLAFRDDVVHLDGDHATLVNCVRTYRTQRQKTEWAKDRGIDHKAIDSALRFAPSLCRWLQDTLHDRVDLRSLDDDFDDWDTVSFRKALVSGYFARAARLAPDGTYRAIKADRPIDLDPASIYKNYGTPPEYVCFCDFALDDDNFDVVARHVARVDPTWLLDGSDFYRLDKHVGIGAAQQSHHRLSFEED